MTDLLPEVHVRPARSVGESSDGDAETAEFGATPAA